MAPKDAEVMLKKVVSFLGLLQGFAFTILTCWCLTLYINAPLGLIPTTYMDVVSYYITQFFLDREIAVFDGQSLTGRVFHGFMWVNLILNVSWESYSYLLLRRNQREDLSIWCYTTLLISCWDFIIVVILGTDYVHCLDYYKEMTTLIGSQEICANGVLPVLVIAAKGFTLWFLNVAVALTLILITNSPKASERPGA